MAQPRFVTRLELLIYTLIETRKKLMSVNALAIVLTVAVNIAAAAPSFSRDIQPILQKKCQGCHQPASKMSGLDLTTFDGFSKGGKRGPAFVTDRPDESVVVRYLTAALQPRMPLGEAPLPESEIALVRDWIRDGAKNDSVAETTELRTPVYLQPPVITGSVFRPTVLKLPSPATARS